MTFPTGKSEAVDGASTDRPEGRRTHWENLYSHVDTTMVNWYQESPRLSLNLIDEFAGHDTAILDVGAGGSVLVDHLLALGFEDISVLDVSETALEATRQRLGSDADRIQWYVADVTTFRPDRKWGLWHDRAVFHFLTEAVDRRRYVSCLQDSLLPGGFLIISTFSTLGPDRCAGLDARRYDLRSMTQVLGTQFEPLQDGLHVHHTPGGEEQNFWWGVFRLK